VYGRPEIHQAAGCGLSGVSEQPRNRTPESAGWEQARPADTTLRADWWQLFGIAKLNGLEEQIDPTNQP